MIYQEKPDGFTANFDVVSCFVEHRNNILLLHRQDYKPQGNTWGIPTGKVNHKKKEGILEAMVREIREETGFNIPQSQIRYFNRIYVRYPEYDFMYYMFSTHLNEKQRVALNYTEHKDFTWTTPEKALEMPLILDLDACIRMFYKI